MFQCSKYNVFSADTFCFFGAVKEDDEFKKVSPTNSKYIFPVNDLWTLDRMKIFNEKGGELETNINLANVDPSLTFISSFSIDEKMMPSFPITKSQARQKYSDRKDVDFSLGKFNLFKQGNENIDGVVDIHFNAMKCTDGIFKELVFKIYFQKTTTINVQKMTYEIEDDSFIGSSSSFLFSINSKEFYSKLFINGAFIRTFSLDMLHSLGLNVNDPFNKCRKNLTLTVGDTKKALQLRSAIITNRFVDDQYAKHALNAIA